MIDLIILSLATFFIINKLVTILGQTDGSEGERRNQVDMRAFSQQQNNTMSHSAQQNAAEIAVDQRDESMARELIDVEVISAHEARLPYSVRNVMKEISALDKTFSTDNFINGVSKAFVAVIHSFSQGDEKTLEFLLDDKVFQSFKKQMDKYRQEGQKLEQRVINMRNISIIDASIDVNNVAKITVSIISEQLYILYDNDGNLIEGSTAQTERINDTWTFSKNLNNSNSITNSEGESAIWKLCNTR